MRASEPSNHHLGTPCNRIRSSPTTRPPNSFPLTAGTPGSADKAEFGGLAVVDAAGAGAATETLRDETPSELVVESGVVVPDQAL
jgi:hypothetical protein